MIEEHDEYCMVCCNEAEDPSECEDCDCNEYKKYFEEAQKIIGEEIT